jgi:hypothetical protein
MISILKFLGGISCSLILWVSLSHALQPEERLCADRNGGSNLAKCDTPQAIDTVNGYVLRVEFDNVVVQRSDGKEVRLHIDENTEMIGYVGPGEHIEAKVNDQSHALSIRLLE